jgi:hypothetical protein
MLFWHLHVVTVGGTPDRWASQVHFKQFPNPPAHWKRENNGGDRENYRLEYRGLFLKK